MSWSNRTALAVLAGGLVGALATIGLHTFENWKTSRRSSVKTSPVPARRGLSRSARKLKLYHTVDGTALPNTKNEHTFPFRSSRCVWLVSELGVGDCVEIKRINLQSQDIEGYRTVHPHATLPALQLDDCSVMLESAAICLYLAEIFLDLNEQNFLPDEEHAAHYYDLICYAASTFDHILEPLYMQLTHTPEEKRNQPLVDSMMRKFSICANVLSQHLSNKQYICGDKFTAADCVVGFNVWWASVVQGGALLDDYPGLRDYLDRLKARPAFEKTFGI